jgi:hypothetical protein
MDGPALRKDQAKWRRELEPPLFGVAGKTRDFFFSAAAITEKMLVEGFFLEK